MIARKLHPVHQVLVYTEKLWALSEDQASKRAHVVARALMDAGYLPDAEVWHGMIITKETEVQP